MKYLGSKNRIAKEILPIILKGREENQLYVEPFLGGGNSIDKVSGPRIGADSNKYLIALFQEVVYNNYVPDCIEKGIYNLIRDNKDSFPDYIVGWAAFGCSYSGKYFGGFAGVTKTKDGVRNYQKESFDNLMRQKILLSGARFVCSDYLDLEIPDGSIVYCDPPYRGTTGYKDKFNHDEFWDWVRKKSATNKVFVSEYFAPADFKCIWEKEVKSSLSANGKCGGNKNSTERLFVLN